jgi:hypothetical protein
MIRMIQHPVNVNISLGESFGALGSPSPCFGSTKPRESHPDSKISKATEKQPQQSAVHFFGGWFCVFFGQRGALRKKEVVEEEVGE